jgi:tetratricopeptide (TPR) repeat protein
MWSPAWNNRAPAGGVAARAAPRALRVAVAALAGLTLAALAACSFEPGRTEPAAAQPVAQPAARATPPPPPSAVAGASRATVPAAAPAAVARPEVPQAARADFARAVNYMRAGNALEAELGFKQLALQYPQFAAPLVNLAILQRKDGHLDHAEETLKSAVAHERGSAVAWNELGATQRMRGEFRDAASSYEQAIAADPRYAPAWRNLGVLSDLYLGDPGRALTAFEQYRQLTGEDKPVSGWIAELRQRLGMPPVKRPAPGAPADGNLGDAVPGAPPAGTPGAAAPPGAPASGPRAAPGPQSQATPGDSLASAAAGGSALRAGG